MGQLRTANKRRNRALARPLAKPIVAAPAKVKTVKTAKSATT